MYVLEVNVGEEWECYQFPTTEKVLDYVYMVEGETYLPEYRNEFQRNAPGTMDIKSLRRTKGFFLWEVGAGRTNNNEGAISYALSWIDISEFTKRRYKLNLPKLSRFWGTVYGVDSGADRARMEKSGAINLTSTPHQLYSSFGSFN